MSTGRHALKLVRELFAFAMANKKWWLVPMVVVSLMLVGLVALSSSPAAPFVYTLF